METNLNTGAASPIAFAPPHVYALDPVGGVARRWRHTTNFYSLGDTPLPNARHIVAFGDRALASVARDFASGKFGIFEVGPTGDATLRFDALEPGPLALRDGRLFVAEGSAGAVHVSTVPVSPPLGALARIEKNDYASISSLAVDDDCVYFFTDGPDGPTLRVRPKLAVGP